jgi:hypothetical protein
VLTEAKKYRDLDRYIIQSKDMGDVNEGFMIAITVLHDPSALQGDYFARPQVLEFEASLTKTNTPLSVCWYNCFKIMALYFLERYEEAAAIAEPNKNLTWSVGGHLCLIPYYSFYALSMLELYPKKDEERQKAFLPEIEECVETLQNWARRSPVNLQAVSQILEAYYLFVVKQEAEKAGLMLGDAIVEADEKGFVYWAGVGSLLLRNIHQKSQVVARHLVSDALNYFSKWGASTISCLLLRKYPYLSAKPMASLTWASGSSPTLGVMSNLNMRLDGKWTSPNLLQQHSDPFSLSLSHTHSLSRAVHIKQWKL